MANRKRQQNVTDESSQSSPQPSSGKKSPIESIITPSTAWLTVFLPALAYFLATRLESSGFQLFRSASLGKVVSHRLVLLGSTTLTVKTYCSELSSILYIAPDDCRELQSTLNVVEEGRGMQGLVASTWKYDAELERGYLLVSQSHGPGGRIWRWEVGGGPIAIGRTLHMEASGCRSEYYQKDCNDDGWGSGGITTDFKSHDLYTDGPLLVAEWGEGRIVRMEENGARTPLIIQVPNLCDGTGQTFTRLYKPHQLLMTPFGDLLVADHSLECGHHSAAGALIKLPASILVEPLDSLLTSRKAHAWNQTTHPLPHLFLRDNIQTFGGMAIDTTWLNLYFTFQKNGRVHLAKVSISPKDDEEEEPSEEIVHRRKGEMDGSVQSLADLTDYTTKPRAIAISQTGKVFVVVDKGILVYEQKKSNIMAIIEIPEPYRNITSLTLGEDKFLYALTSTAILRIRLREGPVNIPTNLYEKAKKK